MILLIFSTEDGISLGRKIHPICLPFETNEDPKKWKNRNVEVVGFATKDFSGTTGDIMRVATMNVFTQETCNTVLDQKLEINDLCKYIQSQTSVHLFTIMT